MRGRFFPIRALGIHALGVALLLGSGVARADDKAECIAAASAAQDLRVARRFGEARDRLLVCARETCPAVVRRDCAQWYTEVESAMPTIVLSVKDDRGVDVTDVRVSKDGKPWLTNVDGKALPVDPGVHVLRAEPADASPVQESVTVREGEKNRVVSLVVMRTPAPAAPRPVEEKSGTPRVLSIVLGSVGLVGLGVGTVFGLKSSSDWSDAKSACADGCLAGSRAYGLRDDARSSATVSTISFVAGGALIAAAAVLFFTSSRATEATR